MWFTLKTQYMIGAWFCSGKTKWNTTSLKKRDVLVVMFYLQGRKEWCSCLIDDWWVRKRWTSSLLKEKNFWRRHQQSSASRSTSSKWRVEGDINRELHLDRLQQSEEFPIATFVLLPLRLREGVRIWNIWKIYLCDIFSRLILGRWI